MSVDEAAVRAQLVAEQQRLSAGIEQMDARERAEKDPNDCSFGEDDQLADEAALASERVKEQTIRKSLEVLVGEIARALHKLDHGTYGQCDSCGNAIPPARLAALPYASLCVACKSRQERGRR